MKTGLESCLSKLRLSQAIAFLAKAYYPLFQVRPNVKIGSTANPRHV